MSDSSPLDGARDTVMRAAGGDPDAWEDLLRRYYPGLVAYARLRLPNEETAARAVHRAFDELHDTIEQPGMAVEVRLFRTLRKAIDDAGAPGPAPATVTVMTTDGDVLPPDPTDEDAVWRDAFCRLGREVRDVVALRTAGGLGEADVARVVSRRLGPVRELQEQALADLRTHVHSQVDDEAVLGHLTRALRSRAGKPAQAAGDPPTPTVVAVRQRAIGSRVGGPGPLPARRGARHYSLLAAVVGGVIVTALFVGLVVGSSLPGPVRSVARALGLPVESAALVRVRAEMTTLAGAMESADGAEAEAADRRVNALVAALEPEERRAVEPVARQLHRRLTETLSPPKP